MARLRQLDAPSRVLGRAAFSLSAARVAVALLLSLAVLAGASTAHAQQERRLGLVIGNAEYAAGALPTAANDAGLVAQTLQAAGFDVMGARDLDGETLRSTFRDFVDKVAASGPDTVAFVYLAGHGLQLEGENYFVPVDARIERDVDIPLRALRVSDYIRPLGGLKTRGVIVVLDAAREAPFKVSGQPLAGGLALVEPAPGMLMAFNAAPGTIGSRTEPPYGAYAQALAEMMREGGLPINAVLDRVRLRVHEATSGAEVPWQGGRLATPVVLFERAADAPAEVSLTVMEERRGRPIQAFDDAREAYLAALERDTMQGYLDFIRAHPDHPLAKRARAIVAARREAITWRRARNADTPEAYWSYLERYPNGPHAADARRRLAFLTAPFEPPPRYNAYVYDVPPPPPEEIVFVRRPFVYFADPVWAFAPPPPPPIFFLPPPPPPLFFRPPPPPIAVFVLPTPVFVPVPVYVRPPVYVAPPPPSNVVFRNIHAPQTDGARPSGLAGGAPPVGSPPAAAPPPNAALPSGAAPPSGATPAPNAPASAGPSTGVIAAGVAAGAIAGAAAASVALPPSVQRRAATPPGAGVIPGASPGGAPAPRPGLPGAGQQQTPTAVPAALPGSTVPGVPPLKGVAPAAVPGSQPATGPALSAPGSPTTPVGRALPGTPAGAPLPAPPASTSAPAKSATGTPPGTPAPGSVPRTGPATTQQGAPPQPLPGVKGPTAPGPANAGPGTPPGGPPRAAAGTPPPASASPAAPAPSAARNQPAPVTAPLAAPPANVRQQRIDRAQQDRAAVQQGLDQNRQREMERRRQEQDAQQRARSQNQQQDLQRQRQQQMEAQRRAMDQQRQQQQAAQAAARAQQQQQASQAAARAQAEAQSRARAQAQQQQQAAQAAARAQAEAQAKARAQQQQQQQAQQKKCGGPGQPPCPR